MARTIAVAVVFLSVTALSAQGPPTRVATEVLRVSRVILYKTGVGYFEHLGTVTGNQPLAVQFTGDQLDDVLKSLTAVDLGEGRVTGISYDSPTPTERRLQALRVPLGQKANTLQLLDALRGSHVEIRSAGGPIIAGRLLNVERRPRQAAGQAVDRDEVTLVTATGEITTVALDTSTRVRVADADLRQDVSRYLDVAASMSDRSPRRVVLSTAGSGTRQVLVSYVGEAAIWKTTYRLVFPSSTNREPLLQGWAVVDNVSAADWDNVELSLVAGAPQTFRQPLSAPLFTTRPIVPLGASAGLAPQTHAAALVVTPGAVTGVVRDSTGATLPGVTVTAVAFNRVTVGIAVTDSAGRYRIDGLPAGAIDLQVALPGFTTQSPRVTVPSGGTLERDVVLSLGGLLETVTVTGASPTIQRPRGTVVSPETPIAPPSREAIEQRVFGQSIAASGTELGDLFEYRLTDRVTIKRNQSALVPILRASVAAERISLWNDAMGLRPRRAIWLTNTSDLTLDAGSLSVVDNGAFGGEGLIDAVKPGERRLVSFAADLGVQVNGRPSDAPARITRVRIANSVVTQDSEERQRRTYTIRNDDRETRVVLIEHPVRPGWTLAHGVTPAESTSAVHRFRVIVPPGQTATLDVDELRPGATTYSINELHRDRLLVMAGPGTARAALDRAMAPVFAKSVEIDGIEDELGKRNEEIDAIGTDQDRVRENLAALKRSPNEQRLLERYTRQLESQENRLDTLKREVASLTEEHSRAARELAQLIASVSIDVTF
jgi:hypothetical protein